MTTEEFCRIVGEIKYKPGFHLEARRNFIQPMIEVRAMMPVMDAYTKGNPMTTVNSMRVFDEGSIKYFTESQVIHMIFQFLLDLETHELKEWFLYRGQRIFDPHEGEVRSVAAQKAKNQEKRERQQNQERPKAKRF